MKPILLARLFAFSVPADDIQVYFSPDGGCTDAIVLEISAAKSNLLVQACSFTSVVIAAALVAVPKRGVNV